jgi:hypothetical protein
MCPECLAHTATIAIGMVAAAGTAGGILAAYIGKFTKLFSAKSLVLFQREKEK